MRNFILNLMIVSIHQSNQPGTRKTQKTGERIFGHLPDQAKWKRAGLITQRS